MGMNLNLWKALKACKDCKKYDCTCASKERAQSVTNRGVKILRTPPKDKQSKPADFKKPSEDVGHTNVTTIKDVL